MIKRKNSAVTLMMILICHSLDPNLFNFICFAPQIMIIKHVQIYIYNEYIAIFYLSCLIDLFFSQSNQVTLPYYPTMLPLLSVINICISFVVTSSLYSSCWMLVVHGSLVRNCVFGLSCSSLTSWSCGRCRLVHDNG